MRIKFFCCQSSFGANIKGSELGPQWILTKMSNSVANYNTTWYDAEEGRYGLESLIKKCSNDIYQDLKSDSIFPVLLGGDHSVAIASILAVLKHGAERQTPVYVFWFDAHADINTFEASESKNIHGMPLAILSGLDTEAMPSAVGALSLDNVCYIGVRSVDTFEAEIIQKHQISNLKDQLTMVEALRAKLAEIPENAHIHVSFDVDCLDPIDAAGVSTPVSNGVLLRKACELAQVLSSDKRFKSLDLVEYNPLQDTPDLQTLSAIKSLLLAFGIKG